MLLLLNMTKFSTISLYVTLHRIKLCTIASSVTYSENRQNFCNNVYEEESNAQHLSCQQSTEYINILHLLYQFRVRIRPDPNSLLPFYEITKIKTENIVFFLVFKRFFPQKCLILGRIRIQYNLMFFYR